MGNAAEPAANVVFLHRRRSGKRQTVLPLAVSITLMKVVTEVEYAFQMLYPTNQNRFNSGHQFLRLHSY